MVAKITIGSSLFGAIKYNADKVNIGKGQLLDTNKVFNNGDGKVDVAQVLADFEKRMPRQMRTEKPIIHISLNPHPDDKLTDGELTQMAHEYMQRMGYSDQPYIIVKHEDIDRHHLHIVSVRVNEQGKRINSDFTKRRSLSIIRDFEQRYGLHHGNKREEERLSNRIPPVNPFEGDIKKQVGNTVKAVFHDCQFQTIGELRALLSLYNLTVEEIRGNVRGQDYNGLVYSVIDADGNKIGNPFKSSLFGKSDGYEALKKKAAFSKKNIKDRNLTEPTKKALEYALKRTYDKDEFVRMLKEKGIDCVFRYTDEGRIYGATTVPVWARLSLPMHSNSTSIRRQRNRFLSRKRKNRRNSRILAAHRQKDFNKPLLTMSRNITKAKAFSHHSLMHLTSSILTILSLMQRKRHSVAGYSARRKSVVAQDFNQSTIVSTI